jgi:hypothetical protein
MRCNTSKSLTSNNYLVYAALAHSLNKKGEPTGVEAGGARSMMDFRSNEADRIAPGSGQVACA